MAVADRLKWIEESEIRDYLMFRFVLKLDFFDPKGKMTFRSDIYRADEFLEKWEFVKNTSTLESVEWAVEQPMFGTVVWKAF